MVAAIQRAIPKQLVTTYLEMTSRAQFRAGFLNRDTRTAIATLAMPDVRFYRFLYDSVGDSWGWRDRRLLADTELLAAIDMPNVGIHVLYVEGSPAGYVELSRTGRETEIAYFGLRRQYHGIGLGKHLLSYGIARAWEGDIDRLTVHTCNLDAPQALANYLKRGFRVYRETHEPMPDRYLT